MNQITTTPNQPGTINPITGITGTTEIRQTLAMTGGNASDSRSSDLDIDLPRGLIAHYTFDGHARDFSSNLSEGIVYGPRLSDDRNGIFGLAYEFDRRDDPRLKPRFPVSISIWLKDVKDNKFIGYSIFTNNFDDQKNRGFWVAVTSRGAISMNYGNGGTVGSNSRYSLSGTTVLEEGEWDHVVAIAHDEDTMSIYVNGALYGGHYSGNARHLEYSNGPGRFGVRDSGSNTPPIFFKGSMDDMRMWNRVLNPNEILVLFLARKR